MEKLFILGQKSALLCNAAGKTFQSATEFASKYIYELLKWIRLHIGSNLAKLGPMEFTKNALRVVLEFLESANKQFEMFLKNLGQIN